MQAESSGPSRAEPSNDAPYPSRPMNHDRNRVDWEIRGFRNLIGTLGLSIVEGRVTVPFNLGPDAGPNSGSIKLAAVGWATVDLDRAEADLGAELATTFEPSSRDALLGAAVRRSTGGSTDGTGTEPAILLLEPDTEGRLSGALARHGEGPVALYLRVPRLESLPTTLSIRAGSGPLGPARLVLRGSPWGPFLILVADRSPGSEDRVPSKA